MTQLSESYRAASVVLMVADKDVPPGNVFLLVQLSWRADSNRPQQAIWLILNQHLRQEDIPRSVMLLHASRSLLLWK